MDRGNQTDDGSERGRDIGRRDYLAGVGALALGAEGLAGAVTQQAGPLDGFAIDRTRNVVEDLGLDPTGETAVGRTLAEAVGSNTRLVFPAGTYRIEQPIIRFGEGIHDFSMVARGDVTLVLDVGSRYWLSVGGAGSRNIHYEGFSHDVRDAESAPRLQLRADDGLVVRNVTHTGVHRGDIGPFRFDVQGKKGRGLIENVRAPDGAPDHTLAVGLFVGRLHRGTLAINDCELAGFPNNGIYQANASKGRVLVRGGTFRNNNIANVRVAGSGSVVQNATIVVDEGFARNDRLGTNVRGIRVANGSDVTVVGCHVTMAASPPSDGAIVVHRPAGSVSVRGCRVTLAGNDIIAVRAKRPLPKATGKRPIDCRNVAITGDAADAGENGDDRAGIEIIGRPGSTVTNTCIHLTGKDRDGVRVADADGSVITGNRVDVTGEAFIVNGSDDVLLRNNTTGAASCPRAETGDVTPAPDDDGADDPAANESAANGTATGNESARERPGYSG